MRPAPAALAALAVLAVLAAPAAAPAQKAVPDGPQAFFGLRLSENPKNEPRTTPAVHPGPAVQLRWSPIGDRAAEPTMGIAQDGTVYYTGRGVRNAAGVRGTKLFRSVDDGATWERIDVFTATPGEPPPDLDPWGYVDVPTGRVFNIALDGAGSFITYSDDRGETWQPSHASSPGFNDHQAFVTAPPPPANPTMRPTDLAFPNIAYYCVNHVTDARCSASRDGGRTWLPTGGPAFAACGSALHGHVQGDRDGRIFLPTGSCEIPSLAISDDGGLTWDHVDVAPPGFETSVNHTEVAVDHAGNLYYVWVDALHQLTYMVTSTDHGQTWTAPLLVTPPTVHETNFPTVVAGEPGRVAVTFPGTTADATGGEPDPGRPWNQYVVISTNALDSEPVLQSSIANPASDPVHRGNCLNRCGGLLDFLDIQLAPSDGAVWVAAVDGCTGACASDPAAAADDNQGGAVKQVGGPPLVGPLPAASDPVRSAAAPGPGALATRDVTAPVVRRFRVTRRSFRPARRARVPRTVTRFSFELSEAATVTIRFTRGRRRAGGITSSASAGRNRLPFTGRSGRRALRPGRYVATVVAVDAAGNRSRPARLVFAVRR